MKSTIPMLSICCLLLFSRSAAAEDPPRNGQIKDEAGVYQVWDDHSKSWVTPEAFWEQYAQGSGGLTWGRTSAYPPFNDVKEHDTIIIETSHGPCLMEFFHTRWRRANDVRRWDERFNEYSGCPHVFD